MDYQQKNLGFSKWSVLIYFMIEIIALGYVKNYKYCQKVLLFLWQRINKYLFELIRNYPGRRKSVIRPIKMSAEMSIGLGAPGCFNVYSSSFDYVIFRCVKLFLEFCKTKGVCSQHELGKILCCNFANITMLFLT